MDIETSKRIKAYQKALPDLRERVIAVALLLAMSLSMLTSASFAWLTISRSPEVSGVNTTVAANGNLEIALASGTTLEPEKPKESKVGDSSATQGQSVAAANITWGNLVNLSDPSYGLDNLTLRPAQLNRSSLLINPLYGASYQEDGRVEKLNSDFGFASWDTENQLFMISNKLGVRAISSVTVEAVGFAEEVYKRRSLAQETNLAAGTAYGKITANSNYMNTLATVMGTYMTAELNPDNESRSNPTMEKQDIKNLRDLFYDFIGVFDIQYQAMADQINYQQFLLNNSESGSNPYTDVTANDLKTKYTTEKLLQDNVNKQLSLSKMTLNKKSVDTLSQMKKDYDALVAGHAQLAALYDQGSVKWKDSKLNEIVDSLMNTGTCTLGGTPINNIGVSNATQYLGGKHDAVITNGVLYNFEYINGTSYCRVEELEVSAWYYISVSVTANISTNAPKNSVFSADLAISDSKNQGAKGVEIAQDTYGLAMDIWVRTNASGSYLTLEGNILTQERKEQALTQNSSMETRPVYTVDRMEKVTQTDEEGNETTEEVLITYSVYPESITQQDSEPNYYIAAPNNEKWYSANTHGEFTINDGEAPKLKINVFQDVIGYEGENRVWEGANAWQTPSPLGLSLDATTQGSGSCYTYYADTPEDMARSLALLESMNVAFVASDGELLAEAEMDTQRSYADNGRVTVPLVMKSESMQIGTDTNGNPLYGITYLEKNVPTQITTIVYLDGTKLGNEDVLSASEIQGKLNIQFGSSVILDHAEDEALMGATRTVSATVDKTTHSYDDYKGNNVPMTSRVTVTVNGDEPSSVTGFFTRTISSTQGSREKVMNFEKQPDGTWTADYSFTAPGEYVLRSVDLDGQTYDLTSRPQVKIEGFTIRDVHMTRGNGTHVDIMTADASSTVGLELMFASDKQEAMPNSVQGRFLRQDGSAVSITFTYNANAGKWVGNATFISSGEYTLQYLVLDGQYTELPKSLQKTASVKLGMKVAVFTDSPIQFPYVPDELTDLQRNLKMKVKIMDNTGEAMENLPKDIRLYYVQQGSSINGMDAKLTWTGKYYEGTFQSKVGVYTFSKVTVSDIGGDSQSEGSVITYAEESPRFNIQSPNPPAFEGIIPLAYRYNKQPTTAMQIRMSYSSGATVAAVIRNLKDNKTYEVQGNMTGDEDNIQTWDFTIPATGEKQDGNWQLETIYVWNYYTKAGSYVFAEVDKDGNLIPGGQRDDPMTIAVSGHRTKAVTTVTATVNMPEGYDYHLGNTAASGSNVTIATADAAFLTPQKITVPTVTIVDFEGQPVGITDENGVFHSYVEDVKFIYDYDGGSSAHGGYTSTAVDQQTANATTVTLVDTGDHKTFTQAAGDVTVTYAGTYTPVLKYTVDKAVESKSANDMGTTSPTIKVWSKAPAVMVSATSVNNTVNAYNGCTRSGRLSQYCTINTKSYTAGITNNNTVANVCYTAKLTDVNVILTRYQYVDLTQPTVTITLSNIGNGSSAVLSFGDSAKIYGSKNGTSISQYSWSGNGTCLRYIGDCVNNSAKDDTRNVAGTINATELVLKDSAGTEYKVPVSITINNPY